MSLNKFFGIGFLARDVSIKQVQVGAEQKSVAQTCIAIDQGKDKQPGWLTLQAWGKTADLIANFKKGDKVLAEGKLSFKTWNDKDGNKKEQWFVDLWSMDKMDHTKKQQAATQQDDTSPL